MMFGADQEKTMVVCVVEPQVDDVTASGGPPSAVHEKDEDHCPGPTPFTARIMVEYAVPGMTLFEYVYDVAGAFSVPPTENS